MMSYLGTVVSPGIGIGPAYQFTHARLKFRRFEIADPAREWERLSSALETAAAHMLSDYERAVLELGPQDAGIFQAHLTMLRDPDLLEGVREQIQSHRANAEAAVYDVSEVYCQQLLAIEDEYIQARAADIRDVRNGLLAALLGVQGGASTALDTPAIVISRFLTPSDCVSMDRRLIRGICTIEGGTTSHVAILARSLGVPAITGADEGVLDVADGAGVILDGFGGALLHSVDAATLARYEEERASKERLLIAARNEATLPATTLDGHRVEVFANLGTAEPAEVEACLALGAEGIGLLRTEFVYLECQDMPDEEQQCQKYRTVTDIFGQRPVVLRTIDIGGDKELPYLPLARELNPFLGVRGLRLSLSQPALFKTQLRAALRAGHGRNLLLMYPMVTKAAEIRRARVLLDESIRELTDAGVPITEDIRVGIMIEVPAAALLADQLADEVDFFSIGTNDLSQYTLAMDRTNAVLNAQVDALDPAVLRLIAGVITAGHNRGRKTAVCGELAGEPLAIPILLGLGLDEFSMNAPAIPAAKRIIRRLKMPEAQGLAKAVLNMESAEQVRRAVLEHLPDLRAEVT
jgi:phosphoenolpyruvate-protein phosphotransferase